MPIAKRLPSGTWRCRVYSHTEETVQPDGTVKKKQVFVSFTCDDKSKKGKRKCEALATEWSLNKEKREKDRQELTLGEAMDKYIEGRENVLSVRTTQSYKGLRKNYLQCLMDIRVDDLTQDAIQKAINIEAMKLSPKTIRNVHGLLSATLSVFRPGFALNTSLPQKQRSELYIPTDDEVKRLLDTIKGTDMELPVLLAAFGPMRRGEISALRVSDIKGNIVHVHRNMVSYKPDAGSRQWIEKSAKTYAGDRYIDYPDFVAKKFPKYGDRVVQISPDDITHKFPIVLKKAKLPHFRFHDLRHYSASIQHALGVPDAYIMQRGGWVSDGTLKNVYRHALADKAQEESQKVNSHFSKTFS